jgi:photosystem II stability/assembly factor-like uncharacterized protein
MYNLFNRKITITATFLAFAFFAIPNASGQWVKVSDTSIASVNAIIANGGVLLAGTSSGFFISTDSGSTWFASNNGLPPYSYNMFVTSLASEDTTVYAGVLLGGVYQSTDFGKQWTQRSAGLISGDVWSVFAHGNLLFAGTPSQGAFRSTDGGISWDSVDSGLPSNASIGQIFFFGTKTFTTVESDFCESNDSGAYWSTILSPRFPDYINTFLAVGSTIYAGNVGLNKSTDTGASWTPLPYEPTLGNGIFSIANFDSELFVGTRDGNVLVSIDSGMNWSNVSSGLPDTTINSLVTAGGYLFAGTPIGIWRRSLSDIIPSGVSENAPMNSSSSLSAFPNPATGMLQIMSEQSGTLHLFDLMGRGRMSVDMEGNSSTLDVSHLEAGMYFLRVGNQSAKVEIEH